MNPQWAAKRRNSAFSTRPPPAARCVEQQLLRNPAEAIEGALQRFRQHRHGLPRIEAQPQQPGVAQDDHQRMAPAPGKRERPEINLALAACRRLEPYRGLDRLARPHRVHVMPHAFIAARVARGADLIEQTLRRELRERLKARVDDPLVRVQLVRHWRTRHIPSRTGRQIPVQLARLDPIMDRSTVHPEPPRQLRLRDALLQVVLQQHPDLPSVHLHTFPALLAKPTSRPGAPSSTSQKVSNFGLAQMGDLQLGLTPDPGREPAGARAAQSAQSSLLHQARAGGHGP